MSKIRTVPDIPPPQEIKINPNSLVIYQPRTNYSSRKGFFNPETIEDTTTTKTNQKPKRNNTTNGFLSDRAGARLKTFIKYLFWVSNCYKIQGSKMVLKPSGHISFLTLTLSSPQQHSDNYIKKQMLNQFITELSKKYHGIVYIWRAEKQLNGNIHFHFLVNKFIPWKWCRMVWNRIQAKEGYIEAYRQKFKNMWFEEYLKEIKNFKINNLPKYKLAFKKGQYENWSNPNSIDVVDLKNAKTIYFYISKYIAKNNNKVKTLPENIQELLKVEGHIYYCSSELLSIQAPREFLQPEILRELDIVKKTSPDSIFHDTFYSLIKLPIEDLFNMGCYTIYRLFQAGFNVDYKNTLFEPPEIVYRKKMSPAPVIQYEIQF